MRLTVGGIVELVGPDHPFGRGLGQFLGQTLGIADEVVGVFVRSRRHLHQFGTGKPQHVFLFLRLGLRNNDNGFEPHRRAHKRKPDAGVARRAFDNGAAGLQLAPRNGIADDKQRRAVFDRLAGVHEFRFAQNFAAGLFARAAQPDQRCVSNGLGQIFCNLHVCPQFMFRPV